ncbi:hypothetical protein FOZ60_015699 [Perkinsus olseni]|uniref:Uncharacterized protein n=1 Tax=Perkinsus olseni TaxID=32597 RepID=A0A7J6PMP9_PEROL|nr:hypothetical protein FOZ60_015699 [Perkinsus olseni]
MAPKQKPVAEPAPVEVDDQQQTEPGDEPVEDPRSLGTGHMLCLLDDDIRAIWDAPEVDRLSLLAERIPIEAADNFREEIEMQLYLTLIEHCSDQRKDGLCLTARQTSGRSHDVSRQIRAGVELDASGEVVRTVEKTAAVDKFRELALTYTIEYAIHADMQQLALLSMPVFSPPEMRLLSDYLGVTFFAHYNLYMYCLMCPRQMERIEVPGLVLPDPEVPPPLEEAAELSDDISGRKQPLEAVARSTSQEVDVILEVDTPDEPVQDSTSPPVEDGQVTVGVQELIESGLDEATALAVSEKLSELVSIMEKKLDNREKELDKKPQSTAEG